MTQKEIDVLLSTLSEIAVALNTIIQSDIHTPSVSVEEIDELDRERHEANVREVEVMKEEIRLREIENDLKSQRLSSLFTE